MPSRRRHTVVALVMDQVATFEFAIGCEVFGFERPDLAAPWYRFVVAAVTPPPITTETGFALDTPHGLEALKQADTVFIPAFRYEQRLPEAVYAAIGAAHRRGARMVSVCTGAFALAEAGILDGRRATTHWMHTAEFSARYPRVEIDRDVLYVDDGDILTSAGSAAGIDLCLHILALDYGAEVANAVARRLVVPPHRSGGQAQFIETPMDERSGDDPFAAALEWAMEHLDEPIDVSMLASRAALSPRHFARLFKAKEGTTPLQWLLHQRILLARRLLETTDLSVEAIAQHCGFQTATTLRPHFQRQVRTTPLAYRQAFRRLGEEEALAG